MPGLDRRGPMGSGPMTGERRGLCSQADYGYGVPVYGGMDFGRGPGMRRGPITGFGPGRGRGHGFACGLPATQDRSVAIIREANPMKLLSSV